MKAAENLRQHPHGGQIPKPDGHRPLDHLVLLGQLLFGLIHQLQNFLGAPAQQHPFAGQRNLSASPVEQPDPHLLLHLGNLTAERGLGDVQHLGCPRDALLPHHRQKISQNPYFHSGSSPPGSDFFLPLSYQIHAQKATRSPF